MQNLIRIKSYTNGLTLVLDQQADFHDILNEISSRFSESSTFFGTTTLPLCIEGRILSDDEEFQITETIQKVSRIKIKYVIEPYDNVIFDQKEAAMEEAARLANSLEDAEVTFQRKSVLPGERIEAEGDLVIFGNVSKDATVLSKRSIIIYGGLYGNAYAGDQSGEEYIITALEFMPQSLSIGDVAMKPRKHYTKWGKKNRFNAQMAFVKNGEINFCEITKELLD